MRETPALDGPALDATPQVAVPRLRQDSHRYQLAQTAAQCLQHASLKKSMVK